MKSKFCSSCKQEKSFDDFYNRKTNKDGKHYQCKQCMNKCVSKYRKTKRGTKTVRRYTKRRTEKYRQSRYEITIKDYDLLMRDQNNCCAICGRPQEVLSRSLSVDHNHLTNEVRGLLCDKCNLGLGFFDTDLLGDLFLIKASKYINKHCLKCKESK